MKRLIILPLLLLTLSLSAAPISEQKAREIATEFFSANATRSSAVQLAWAGDDAYKISNVQTRSTSDSALMYIYNRTDSKGFVIIAGDDSAPRPILAFSYDNDFDTGDVADGARMLLADLCAEIENTKYSTHPTSNISTRASVGKVVCEYKTALWGQGAPFNNESPIFPSGEKTITGCVATALAIVAHYHKWPEKGVGTTPEYTYSGPSNIENTVPANTLGRTYRYDMMLDKYEGVSYTKGQGD
ncbi:MAG: Spi family protease inhibitor, partial [Alistipes sp.]|nr:Spi family protease inhibitor [Alistipes sp.]